MKGLRALLLGAFCLFAAPAAAEQIVRDGEYLVHYAAMPTMAIAPEVARQFGVTRARGSILLLLNAQRLDADGRTLPVPASASGTARSLTGHEQRLALRTVSQGGVHDVIAEARALDGEFLVFDLSVQIQGAPRPLSVRFKQQFFDEP